MAGNTVDLFGAKGAKQALDLLEEARVGVLGQAEEAQKKVAQALADTAQFTDDARRVIGTYSLGREPFLADPAGIYRWAGPDGVVDIAWDGQKETSRTPAVLTQNTLFSTLGNQISDLKNKSVRAGPQVAGGSRWLWQPAVPGTLAQDGGTVQPAKDGGYWVRDPNTAKLPEWYEATPWRQGDTPVDAGPALQAWLDGAQIGETLYTDKVFYVGKELVLNRDSISLDFQGQLRPMPGYTGFLFRYTGLNTPKKQYTNSLWQTTGKVYALNADGENRSRGVWFQHLDHYIIENVQVRRTNGCAIRHDACREGASRNLVAALCRQGPDGGVVEFVDQNAGADANNTIRVYDLKVLYSLGTHLLIDSPKAYLSEGSSVRLIDFYGIQIETVGPTVGNSALDTVFTPEITGGVFKASEVYDPTVDLVKIFNSNVINFWGGHFFFDTVQLPNAKNADGTVKKNPDGSPVKDHGAGGMGIRLGKDADAHQANAATRTTFNGCAVFAHNGDGCIFGLHNATGVKLDVVVMDELNRRPLKWVSGASQDYLIKWDKQYVKGGAAEAVFNAIGPDGEGVSAAYHLRTGNGKEGRLLLFDNAMSITPDLATDLTFFFRNDGGFWVGGKAKARLGIPEVPVSEVTLGSPDGTKRLTLTVGNDGGLYANDGSTTRQVTLT